MIGENLLDVAYNKPEDRPNEVYAQISESKIGRCIRTERYLYSIYAPNINGGEKASTDKYSDDCLYDMSKDPHQLTNLILEPEYDSIKDELRTKLKNWIKEVEDIDVIIQ